jgi:hypothetical protein
VPVLGQVWDLATAHWTNTANFEVGVRDTQKLINLSATGVEGLSAKYMQLTERRKAVYDSNVFAVKGGSDLKDQELWKIDQERARVAHQISAAVKDNLIASNSLLSGSEKATKIKQAELATAKEIADIENAGKDAAGNMVIQKNTANSSTEWEYSTNYNEPTTYIIQDKVTGAVIRIYRANNTANGKTIKEGLIPNKKPRLIPNRAEWPNASLKKDN